jgi:hypothetical protein
MAFTTVDKVRTLTGLSETQVSDEIMSELISEATREVGMKINSPVIREKVEYIDYVRENDINGTNSTFYVRNFKKFIGDRNRDGDVTTTDIIVYQVDSSDNESTASVSLIYPDQGKFTLTTAPLASIQEIFVTYDYSTYQQEDSVIDSQVSLATSYLAAAYAFAKKDLGTAGNVKFGNITINKKASESFAFYYDRYIQIIKNLNSAIGGYKEGTVKI